jgi:outer membrane autotransporter protein
MNGSFETGNFAGWQTTVGAAPGSPAVIPGGLQIINATPTTMPNPPSGNFQAFIQSTGEASAGEGVSAADLEAFLNTTAPLPESSTPGPVFNGTAIKQTVSLLGSSRLTFSYGYQSRETVGLGQDETGYTVNGVFHILVDSDTPGVTAYTTPNGPFESFLPYQTRTITLNSGTNTIGFLSYNTVTDISTTGLLLDNLVLIPLFGTIPGLTPNQLAVATYIDNNDNNGGGNLLPLVTALGGLANDPTSLGQALDQLSPQSLQIFRHIAFDNATFNTLDVNNHLANLRDGLTGFDSSQLSVNDPGLSAGASRIKNRLHDPKDMRDPKEMDDTKEMTAPLTYAEPDRWSTFIVGDVVLAQLDHDQDLSHQDYTTGGVMLGTDYRVDQHWTVGGLLSYNHTDATLDHIGSSATVDTYSIGLYGSYVDGPWYGNALVTYGFNSYTEDRNIAIGDFTGTNHGAPQGNQYTASLTGGYEFQTGHFKYGPIAGIQYVNLGINSFTEDGPTALNVQSQSDDSFRSQLGFEARYAVQAGSVCLVPHASATWQHEYLDGNHDITSQFNSVGTDAFTVQTSPTDHDSAVIDVGVNVDVARNVTFFTDYQTEVGAENFFAQSVSAGVRISY